MVSIRYMDSLSRNWKTINVAEWLMVSCGWLFQSKLRPKDFSLFSYWHIVFRMLPISDTCGLIDERQRNENRLLNDEVYPTQIQSEL